MSKSKAKAPKKAKALPAEHPHAKYAKLAGEVKVKFLQHCIINGHHYDAGSVHLISKEQAASLHKALVVLP